MDLMKSPLVELKEMQRQMAQELDGQPPSPPAPAQDWQPPTDIWEDDQQLVLVLELAGVDQSAVDIQIEEQLLIVSGQRQLEEAEGRQYQRVERSYGSFCRQFNLPSAVERGRVRASCEQGLLRIVLPKSDRQQPLHIAIDPA